MLRVRSHHVLSPIPIATFDDLTRKHLVDPFALVSLSDLRVSWPDGTDMAFLANIQDGSHIGFKDIDLTGIKAIHFRASTQEPGSFIEVRQGGPLGKLIGKARVNQVEKLGDPVKLTHTAVENAGQGDLYFVFRNDRGKKEDILFMDWMLFDNGNVKLP